MSFRRAPLTLLLLASCGPSAAPTSPSAQPLAVDVAHCGIGRHREQAEAWNKQAEALLLSLQQAQSACAKEGNTRRPLTAEETEKLHIDVGMFVEADGSTTLVSALQRLPTMRADIALCMVRVFEKARFAPPEGRALLRTNVTFSPSAKQ